MGWCCPDVLRAPALPTLQDEPQQTMPVPRHWHRALEGSASHHFTGRTDVHVGPFPSETQQPSAAHGMRKGPARLFLLKLMHVSV